MPEELEVSSPLEQGQVVKSSFCKRRRAALTQHGSGAHQIFLTPTTSTSLPPPDGTEGTG